MTGRRAFGGLGRGAAALAALLVGTVGLAIGTAQPAQAIPPRYNYFTPPSSLPYGYTGGAVGIIFADLTDGGTLTFFADGSTIANCTQQVTASDPTYYCSLRTLAPGTYTISATYSGGTYDGFSVVMTPDVQIRKAVTKLTSTTPTPVNPGVDFTVSATLTGDDVGSDAPVDGVSLTFTVPGDTCTATTSATGVASCTVTAPTADSTADPTTDFDVDIAFAGDDRYLPRTATAGIALAKSLTATSITVVPNTGSWGTTAVVTATIIPSDATGTVAFSDESGPITGCSTVTVVGGSASCSYPLPLGYGAVTATYSGDALYRSSSDQLGTRGDARPTSVDLASPAGLTVGSATSVSATVHDLFTGDLIVGITVFFTLGDAGCSAATGASGVATCLITPQNTVDTTLEAALILSEAYVSSSDSIAGLTVAKAATTTTVAPATAPYQAPLTITATVEHAEAGGTVEFRADGGPIGGCEARPVTLSAGSWTATCTTTTLPVGAFPVIGIYSGTANTEASTSPAQDVSVTPASTTLTYTGDTSAIVGIAPTGQAVLRSNATGAGIPDQPVSFTWPSGSCSATTDAGGVAACSLDAPDNAGSPILTVAYAGSADGSFLGSSTTVDIEVAKASTTTTLQVPADAVYGELTPLVAVVTPPGITGTVAFTVDGDPIAGCEAVVPIVSGIDYLATCTTPGLPAGEQQISAAFSGNANYAPSIAPAQPLTVAPGPTALEYMGDTTGTIDVPVTVRARLTRTGTPPATGPLAGQDITFTGAGGTCSAPTDASGVAECTITPDAVADGGPITASFPGTAEYQASETSAGLTVGRVPTTTIVESPNNAEFGEAVRLSAVVAPTDGDGTVTFRTVPTGAPDAGAVIAGCGDVALALVGADWTATCDTSLLPAGALTITATYSGGARHLPSSAATALTIEPAWTDVMYTGASTGMVATPLTLAATLTARPGGPPTGIFIPELSYAMALAPAAPAPGMTLTFALGDLTCSGVTDAAGTASCTVMPTDVAQSGTVQVSFAGTSEYAAAHRAAAVTIAPMATSVTLTAPTTVGFSLPVELVATVTPTPAAGTVAFTDSGAAIPGCEAVPVGADGTARCTAPPATLGSHDLVATFAGTSSFLPASSTPTALTVVPAATALTYQGPTTATVGVPITVSAVLTVTGPNAPAAGSSPFAAPMQLAGQARPLSLGLAGQELSFTLGDAACTGTTDPSGTATCVLSPPTTPGETTLGVGFSGSPGYQPVSIQLPMVIAATPMLPATGSDSSTPLAVGAGLLVAGLTATRLRRRRA